jgi:hypothetical protein
MEPVPDIDLIKGGMWPIIEIVYMDKFWAPIYSRRLDRYDLPLFSLLVAMIS